ncbi:Protein DD3-3 [Durusdinium trenchii]
MTQRLAACAWILALLHGFSDARWVLAGFGHCTEPLEIWHNKDLAGCLRSCEVAGSQCSYVSFLDDSLIRAPLDDEFKVEMGSISGALSGGSLCWLYGQCEVLKTTFSGAATFVREDLPKYGQVPDDGLVTISTARSMSSRSTWQLRKQLCMSVDQEPSVALKDVCADLWKVTLASTRSARIHSSSFTVRARVTIRRGKEFLCSQGPKAATKSSMFDGLSLSESCKQETWDIVREGENQQSVDSEPCMWLRVAQEGKSTLGKYLSVSEGGKQVTLLPWSTNMSRSCWHFGYQTWMQHSFVGRDDFDLGVAENVTSAAKDCVGESKMEECQGSTDSRKVKRVPHLWLMASPNYVGTMEKLLSTFRRAEEPLRVSVRWVTEIKDTSQHGFSLAGAEVWSSKVYGWNYWRLLILFEAYLDAVQSQDHMVMVMDLDFQVRSGWTQTLEKCLDATDICFLQQGGFGNQWQQANGGLWVFKPTAAVGAFYHTFVARMQTLEILVRLLPSTEPPGPMPFEQLMLNYILYVQVPRFIGFTSESQLGTLKWGIYNPLTASCGMFFQCAVLGSTVHHATGSFAVLKNKLRFMDAAELFVSDLREFCPLHPSGQPQIIGPLPAFCFLYVAVDPHFGPLLDSYNVYGGFSAEKSMEVTEHLKTRPDIWTKTIAECV